MCKHFMLIIALVSFSLFARQLSPVTAQSAQPMDCLTGDVQQIQRDVTQSGSIYMIDQIRSYWLIAQAGVTLQVNLDVMDGFDGVVSLYKLPDGYLVYENSQPTGGDEQLTYAIEATDKYCIVVSGYQGAIGNYIVTFSYADVTRTEIETDYVLNTESIQESSVIQLLQTTTYVPDHCLYPRELIAGLYPATVAPYDIYYAQVYLDTDQANRDELAVTVRPTDFDAVVRIYSPVMRTQQSNVAGHGGEETVVIQANVTGYYCITVYGNKMHTGGSFNIEVSTQ